MWSQHHCQCVPVQRQLGSENFPQAQMRVEGSKDWALATKWAILPTQARQGGSVQICSRLLA